METGRWGGTGRNDYSTFWLVFQCVFNEFSVQQSVKYFSDFSFYISQPINLPASACEYMCIWLISFAYVSVCVAATISKWIIKRATRELATKKNLFFSFDSLGAWCDALFWHLLKFRRFISMQFTMSFCDIFLFVFRLPFFRRWTACSPKSNQK